MCMSFPLFLVIIRPEDLWCLFKKDKVEKDCLIHEISPQEGLYLQIIIRKPLTVLLQLREGPWDRGVAELIGVKLPRNVFTKLGAYYSRA